MKNWGFSVLPDRQTNYDELDRTLYYLVKRIEPSVSWCIACGSCAATCVGSQNSENMNLRKVISMLSNGLYEELEDCLSSCRLCGKCTLVCPKGVNTRGVILAVEKAITIKSK